MAISGVSPQFFGCNRKYTLLTSILELLSYQESGAGFFLKMVAEPAGIAKTNLQYLIVGLLPVLIV